MEFSRDRKSMSVYCTPANARSTRSQDTSSTKMFVKGAPESILDRCTNVRVGKDTVKLTSAMKRTIINNVTQYGTGLCCFFR